MFQLGKVLTTSTIKLPSSKLLRLTGHYLLANYSECCDKEPDKCKNTISPELECGFNKQILAEFNACYAYLSMATYFARTSIALPGCAAYFMKMHHEEHEHALMFINYQTMRGGNVALSPITCPTCGEWTIKDAFQVALEMEKIIKTKLIDLHNVAEKNNDLSAMNVITAEFLDEQDRSICEMGRINARYNMMCESRRDEYVFDKHIFKSYVETGHKSEGPQHKSILKDTKHKIYA